MRASSFAAAVLSTLVACGGGRGDELGAGATSGDVEVAQVTVDAAGASCVGAGSSLPLLVTVSRGLGPATDVTVTVETSADFLSVDPLTIPAASDSGTLVLHVADDAPRTDVSLVVHAGDAAATVTVDVGPAGLEQLAELPVDSALTANALVAVVGDEVVVASTSDPDGLTSAPSSTLAMFDADGVLDARFGSDGVLNMPAAVTALAGRRDGSLVVGMVATSAACADLTVIDPQGGLSTPLTAPSALCSLGQRIAPQRVLEAPDGSIYACGWVWNCCGFAERRTSDGNLDEAFGDGGAVYEAPLINSAYDCSLGADGALAIGVYQGVVKLDGAGALVFDDASGAQPLAGATVDAIVVAADGTIFAAGEDDQILAALTSDGKLDDGFGDHGVVPLASPPRALVLRDDRLYLLTSTGLQLVAGDGASQAVASVSGGYAMAKDSCGRLVVATYEESSAPTATVRVARFWP